MSIELIRRGPDGIDGILSLYEIPNEFAENNELFDAWWLPKTEIGSDGLYHITEQRLVMEPVHNLITNAGISRVLTNQSVTAQASQQPFSQILATGNGACTGVLRTDTTVPGDGFASGSRKAPASYYINGFLTTLIFQFGTGDAVGTWTSVGIFGGGSATTTAATGVCYTHALMPFSKGSSSYSVNYAFLLGN
jgi:hypothetical protein